MLIQYVFEKFSKMYFSNICDQTFDENSKNIQIKFVKIEGSDTT